MVDDNDHHSIRPWNTYPVGEDDEDMADEETLIREKEILIKDKTKEEMKEGKVEDEIIEEEMEEGRIMKGKRPIRQPTRDEYEAHRRTHIPFRKWCPHCVKGKRKNDPHKAPKEKEDQEVPTMSWDYMEQRGKDGKIIEEEDGRNKTLIGIDRENKWVSSIVVQKKGLDPYAVEAVGREIGNSGFNRVIVKSDQEASIRKLLEAVKNERAEEIELVPEKSPVGESRANGEVERYVQTIQGQVRTLKMALETRYQKKIGENHNILPWLVMYAGMLINICSIGEDGKTAYERRRGKSFKRDIPEFGESIWYLKPGSAGKDKLDRDGGMEYT